VALKKHQKLSRMKYNYFFLLTITLFTSFMTSCKSDPCKNTSCGTNGICADGTCLCSDGYEGNNCETKWQTKFIGKYTTNQVCTNGTGGPLFKTPSEITVGPGDLYLTIDDKGITTVNRIARIVSPNKIVFQATNETWGNWKVIVSGSGVYENGVLKMETIITDFNTKAVTYTCTVTMTKN
jgi:hypothetical protein